MIPRPTYLRKLIQSKDTDTIKIITDVRRSGKSVLLKLYRDYLIAQGIDFNFEVFELLNVRDDQQLIDQS